MGREPVFMGVMVTVIFGMPEFWVFIAAFLISCSVLAVFLWRMETEIQKVSASGKRKRGEEGEMEGAAALLVEMGYDYDARQGILVSRKDAWQRQYGYSRLYDEAAANCGVIVHCEPIPFEFEGRRYLLALWKGQYSLSTGGEIGLYWSERPDAINLSLFSGPRYGCVPEEEWPIMEMTLFHHDDAVLTLEERRGWLAGHRLGLYARPEDLVLRASVTFKSGEMAQAAYNGLFIAGYSPWEIGRVDETVFITFTHPHTAQPQSQRGLFARLTRLRLRLAVRRYCRAVGELSGMEDIVSRLGAKSPALIEMLQNSVRSRCIFAAQGAHGLRGK